MLFIMEYCVAYEERRENCIVEETAKLSRGDVKAIIDAHLTLQTRPSTSGRCVSTSRTETLHKNQELPRTLKWHLSVLVLALV